MSGVNWWPPHAYTLVHVSTHVQQAEHTHTHKRILDSQLFLFWDYSWFQDL